MRKRTWVMSGVLVAVVAAVALMVGVGSAAFSRLEASMNGDNELDQVTLERGAGDPNGTATAIVRVNPATRTVCFDLDWRKIQAPARAHIHEGNRTANGDIIVPLFETGEPPPADETDPTDQDLPASLRSAGGCVRDVAATRAQLRDIRDNPRQFYVNIHNNAFPAGAVRGQLHP